MIGLQHVTIKAPVTVLKAQEEGPEPFSDNQGPINANFPEPLDRIWAKVQSEMQACETQMKKLREVPRATVSGRGRLMGEQVGSSASHNEIQGVDVEQRVLVSQHHGLDYVQDRIQIVRSRVETLRDSIVNALISR